MPACWCAKKKAGCNFAISRPARYRKLQLGSHIMSLLRPICDLEERIDRYRTSIQSIINKQENVLWLPICDLKQLFKSSELLQLRAKEFSAHGQIQKRCKAGWRPRMSIRFQLSRLIYAWEESIASICRHRMASITSPRAAIA